MPGGGGKGGGKGGAASNAVMQSDEDIKAHRRLAFSKWKQKQRPNRIISYDNSPSPPINKSR